MGALLKLIFCIYLITLIFSMIIALIKFIIDTHRWHDLEEKFEVIASSFEDAAIEDNTKNQKESEVENNGTDDGQCNTSAFSVPWGES